MVLHKGHEIHQEVRWGHRIFVYQLDFFGPTKPSTSIHANQMDTADLIQFIHSLSARLGLRLHPTKTSLVGVTQLVTLSILVDTEWREFILSLSKLSGVLLPQIVNFVVTPQPINFGSRRN